MLGVALILISWLIGMLTLPGYYNTKDRKHYYKYVKCKAYKHRYYILAGASLILFAGLFLAIDPKYSFGLILVPLFAGRGFTQRGMGGTPFQAGTYPYEYWTTSNDLETEVTNAVALGAKNFHMDYAYSPYTVSSAITDDISSMSMVGHGSTVTHTAGTHIFQLSGSLDGWVDLTANADANQDQYVMTGTGLGISAYDCVLVKDDDVLYGVNGVEKGELTVVDSVAEAGNSTITAKTDIIYSYTLVDNATATRVSMLEDITFKNINFLGTDESTDTGNALLLTYCWGVDIINCEFSQFGECSTLLRTCLAVNISGSYFERSIKVGNGYGVSICDASYDVSIDDCRFFSCRHGVTHGYSLAVGYSQFTSTTNSTFIDSNFDCHPETGESVLVGNCQIKVGDIDATVSGIDCRGGNVTIENCRVHDAPSSGIKADDDCLDMTVINCTIKNVGAYGIFIESTDDGKYTLLGNIIEKSGDTGIDSVHGAHEIVVNGNIILEPGKFGIRIYYAVSGVVSNNIIRNPGQANVANYEDGIYLYDLSDIIVANNNIFDNQGTHTLENGIFLNASCINITIIGNTVKNCNSRGIYLVGAGGTENQYVKVWCNTINTSGDNAIRCLSTSKYTNISGNTVISSTARSIDVRADNTEVTCNYVCGGASHGINLVGTQYCNVFGNYVTGSGDRGINLEGSCTLNSISSNWVYNITNNAIQDDTTCTYNYWDNNKTFGSTYGLYCRGDNNTLMDNIMVGNSAYGCRITNEAVGTTFIGNRFYNNTNGPLLDEGTNTKLPSITVPFTWYEGGATMDAMGILVDANGEVAAGSFTIPDHLQQIIDIEVYAESQVLEADAMEGDFEINGGAPNEVWNNHGHSFSGLDSDTTNFAANDWIKWVLADADLDDFQPGDVVNFQSTHAGAAGANCQTDAKFSAIKVRYV
jgi:parallel beta-helix repeat protein